MPGNKSATSGCFIHPTSVVDDGAVIGNNTKIWHFSHIMPDTIIGSDCNLGQNVVAGPGVSIGNCCKIQNNVSIYKGVTLEDGVFCGPSMVFTNVFNPRSHIRKMNELRPTLVKKGATLGANCTIVCGVTIGKYAFVGAGAVVTKDVPDHALVIGNPARQTGWICKCGEKLNPGVSCPVCGWKLPSTDNMPGMAFVDLAEQQKRIRPQIQKAINCVLGHGKYIMGPEVTHLEEQLASFTGSRYAITCSSGTDALLMALMAHEIGPGDAVFTTPFTFVATAEMIELLGATPVFVDIDSTTFNMSPKFLETAISTTAKKGVLTPKAIIAVDLFGLPADYNAINTIASSHRLKVIEDGAQSFGGEYKGESTGTLAHIGCTSFFPAKPLGCYGDGGAIFTDDHDTADRLTSLRVHGKGHTKYNNIRIGINGRLDTLQAAILLEKLKIFTDEIQCRQKIAKYYTQKLAALQPLLQLPHVPKGYKSAWAQYALLAESEKLRKKILGQLGKNDIPTAIYYPVPLHLQPAFKHLKYNNGDFPESEHCASKIFCIPMHPYLTREQQNRICACIGHAL